MKTLEVKNIIGDDLILQFSTGKTLSTNNNLIGIAPDMSVSDGYDSMVHFEGGAKKAFTKVERKELADYMIKLWQQYRKI